MKFRVALWFVLLASLVSAQGRFADFLVHIDSLNYIYKSAAVDSFMAIARAEGIPFVENDTATFIYLGAANKVQLSGDENSWASNPEQFSRISATNLFYQRRKYEMNARLDYKLIINGSNWILDPENPNTCEGGYGANSEFAMPDYEHPWEIEDRPGTNTGTIEQFNIFSQAVDRNYRVYVYKPHGYNDNPQTRYPSVYYQDGSDYINLGAAKQVLDNLIDSENIPPVLAFFVVPNNRTNEYTEATRFNYSGFFALELVNYVDSAYRTIPDRKSRVVLGDSFGGNISALISWLYPDVFGLLGLHSAAFWPNDYEVSNILLNYDKKDIKCYSVWGSYESLSSNLRTVTDTMISKGYEINWAELPEGHSWGLWKATTDDILEYLLDGVTTSVDESTDNDLQLNEFKVFTNYPNPFNPSTYINFFIPHSGNVKINVYNVIGEKISTLTNKYFENGYHKVKFSADNLISGVYIYTVETGNLLLSEKMVLIK